MKKAELLARIEQLEKRIAALEARPAYYVPIHGPRAPLPQVMPSTPWFHPPFTVTCAAPTPLPGTCTSTGVSW